MNRKLRILGAGGHGKVIADIAKCSGFTDIAFLDDNPAVTAAGNYPVVGRIQDAPLYSDSQFFVAIGNSAARARLQEWLAAQGLTVATVVHPGAIVAEDAVLGEGSVVMAGAVINPGAVLEKGAIVNTCASVDHDCQIGRYVHIAVGAHLAGTVTVGDGCWIGAGAIISNNITVTPGCMIGAGAVVVKDITESGTYIGVPAKKK